MKKVLKDTEVVINGVRLALPGEVQMNINSEDETITTIEHPYDFYEHIRTTADGSIKFHPFVDDDDSSDPISIMDAMGLRQTYLEFDPTTELLNYRQPEYGLMDEPSPSYGVPQIPIELRQLKETGALAVQEGGAYEMVAYRFKAAADSLKVLRFLARNNTGDSTSEILLEVWSDNSGVPGSQIGTKTATIHFSAGVDSGLNLYTGQALAIGATYTSATWQSVNLLGVDILDSNVLTPGEYYWIVFVGQLAEDSVYFNFNSDTRAYPNSSMYKHNGTSWSNNNTVGCFVIQQLNSYGGGTIVIYEKTGDNVSSYKWTLDACHYKVQPPTMGPQKKMELSINFNSRKVIGPIRI